MKMAMMNETPAMMMVVDPPVMVGHDVSALVVDQLMTRQLAMQSTQPLKASWVFAEKPEVSDELEGFGLLLQLKQRNEY